MSSELGRWNIRLSEEKPDKCKCDRATSKPRILAITRDRAFLKALRLEMPLLNLRKQCLIEDYYITDPSLFDVPEDALFDVIWLQRVNDPELIGRLADLIDSHYLYDLDDLLFGAPSYRRHPVINADTVREAISRCRVLTVTSRRLAGILEKVGGLTFGDKAVVCPNAGEFPGRPRVPSRPQGIILTSSEELALTESGPAVLDAVREFATKHRLCVYHFGPKNPGIMSAFHDVVSFGRVPYWHYQAVLGSLPPMIAIAPLETRGDPVTQDFINGKSDIKMVEFGGFGHPGVYSNAMPFVDTDIRAGIVVENTRDAWEAGLTAVYEDLWRRLDQDQEMIVQRRHMDLVARDCWSEAVHKARLPEPVPGRDLKHSRGKVSFFVNAAKHMVLSQDHAFLKRLEAEIPPVLRRILRRKVLKN